MQRWNSGRMETLRQQWQVIEAAEIWKAPNEIQQLFNQLFTEGCVDEAKELIAAARERGVPLDPTTILSCLGVIANSGRAEEANDLYQSLSELDTRLAGASNHELVSRLIRDRLSELNPNVVDQGNPDLRILLLQRIEALCYENKWLPAYQYFTRLTEEEKRQANERTLNVLITQLSKIGSIEEATTVYTTGLEQSGRSIDSRAYSTLVNAYSMHIRTINRINVDQANTLITHLYHTNENRLDTFAINATMRYFSDRRNLDKVLKIFESAFSNSPANRKPDSYTYGVLFLAHVNAGKLESAWQEVFRAMFTNPDFLPDDAIINIASRPEHDHHTRDFIKDITGKANADQRSLAALMRLVLQKRGSWTDHLLLIHNRLKDETKKEHPELLSLFVHRLAEEARIDKCVEILHEIINLDKSNTIPAHIDIRTLLLSLCYKTITDVDNQGRTIATYIKDASSPLQRDLTELIASSFSGRYVISEELVAALECALSSTDLVVATAAARALFSESFRLMYVEGYKKRSWTSSLSKIAEVAKRRPQVWRAFIGARPRTIEVLFLGEFRKRISDILSNEATSPTTASLAALRNELSAATGDYISSGCKETKRLATREWINFVEASKEESDSATLTSSEETTLRNYEAEGLTTLDLTELLFCVNVAINVEVVRRKFFITENPANQAELLYGAAVAHAHNLKNAIGRHSQATAEGQLADSLRTFIEKVDSLYGAPSDEEEIRKSRYLVDVGDTFREFLDRNGKHQRQASAVVEFNETEIQSAILARPHLERAIDELLANALKATESCDSSQLPILKIDIVKESGKIKVTLNNPCASSERYANEYSNGIGLKEIRNCLKFGCQAELAEKSEDGLWKSSITLGTSYPYAVRMQKVDSDTLWRTSCGRVMERLKRSGDDRGRLDLARYAIEQSRSRKLHTELVRYQLELAAACVELEMYDDAEDAVNEGLQQAASVRKMDYVIALIKLYTDILRIRGRTEQIIQKIEALQLFLMERWNEDIGLLADIGFMLAETLDYNGDTSQALEKYTTFRNQQLLLPYRHRDYLKWQKLYRITGNFEGAIACLDSALSQDQDVGSPEEAVLVLADLKNAKAANLADLGFYIDARDLLLECLSDIEAMQGARTAMWWEKRVIYLNQLGYTLARMGEFNEAYHKIEWAFEISRKCRNEKLRIKQNSILLNTKAQVYILDEKIDGAISILEQAYVVSKSGRNRLGMLYSRCWLGLLEAELGNVEASFQYAQEALTLLRDEEQYQDKGLVCMCMGLVLSLRRDEAYNDYISKAEELVMRYGAVLMKQKLMHVKSLIDEATKDWKN